MMQTILPSVFTFTSLLVGRVYAIVENDEVTLIDTGLSLAFGRIVVQLKKAGIRPEQIRRILITHAHPDHVGSLPALKAISGAAVICSETERPIVAGEQPSGIRPNLSLFEKLTTPPPQRFPPVTITKTVNDGDVIEDLLGGLQVVATPGHTYGQIAFWQPERRLLFAADTVLNLPRLRLPFAAVTMDMDMARQSVKKIATLEPDILCCGHGSVVKNAAESLKKFAAAL